MSRNSVLLLLCVVLAPGCANQAGSPPSQAAPRADQSAMKPVTFLTRDGCSNTATMRENLDEALRSLGLPAEYQVINLASLPGTDARGGYPTPTVLHADKDLFGMAEPTLPYPPPT